MYAMGRILLCLLALSRISFSLDIRGKIQWNTECPSIGDMGPSKVMLDDGEHSGGVMRDGRFVIPDVPVGTYILSVSSHDHSFDQLRIDVLNETNVLPEVRPYVPATPLNPPSTVILPYPITLVARQKNVYFVPQESFNLLAMFQNPMMIMMVVVGVMVLAMPYIMKNMDPEMLDEFKERQAKMHSIQNSLQNGDIKSSISALLTEPDDRKSVSSAKQEPVSTRNRKGKSKKRS